MSEYFEAEVIIGIEDIAIRELKQLSRIDRHSIQIWRDGFVRFRYTGNTKSLSNLRSIVAIYQIHSFDIPRPKAFLGHQHLTRLLQNVTHVTQTGLFTSLSIGAAGAESTVMQRIKHELAQNLNLTEDEDNKGDVYLRLVPNHKQSTWEALIRLTPRPLSTRAWRIENMPGALNATVAYAMTQLVIPIPEAHVVNLCSGTGTLLIEHTHSMPQNTLIGVEIDRLIIDKAHINMIASHTSTNVQCVQGDAMQTPFPDAFADMIYADLPFGQHVGTHDENLILYPAIVEEASRIAKKSSRFIIITHEIQLIESVLQHSKWHIIEVRKINLGGLHPRIFVLERK